MLKIEIADAAVVTTSGTFDDGREWVSRKQQGYLHAGQKYPVPFNIKLGKADPYPAGLYTLDDSSFYIGNNLLQLASKVNLVPYK